MSTSRPPPPPPRPIPLPTTKLPQDGLEAQMEEAVQQAGPKVTSSGPNSDGAAAGDAARSLSPLPLTPGSMARGGGYGVGGGGGYGGGGGGGGEWLSPTAGGVGASALLSPSSNSGSVPGLRLGGDYRAGGSGGSGGGGGDEGGGTSDDYSSPGRTW